MRLDDHGGRWFRREDRLFGGTGEQVNGGDFGVVIFKAGSRKFQSSFNGTEADALAVADTCLAFDAGVVDPCAIAGSAVANDDLATVTEDFTVKRGDSIMLDDQGIAGGASDGSFAFRELERLSREFGRREDQL